MQKESGSGADPGIWCGISLVNDIMRPERATVFSGFEGIGNNCEFGIVQRAAGANLPGLFRNGGYLHTEQITKAIKAKLDKMFDEGHFEFTAPDTWHDYALDCKRYGFRFHTGIDRKKQENLNEKRTIQAFRLLKRQFLELVEGGGTTFVYRHDNSHEVSEEQIERLWAALCTDRANDLLVVAADDRPASRFGHVERKEPGLFRASMSRLSAENPPQIDFAAWETICRAVVSMQDEAAEGQDDTHSRLQRLPRDADHPAIISHYLPRTAGLADARLMEFSLEGLGPGSTYTVEAEIFIPTDVNCASLTVAMLGYPSERFVAANVTRKSTWQRVSVTAKVPPTKKRAVAVFVAQHQSGRDGPIFSSNWSISAQPPEG